MSTPDGTGGPPPPSTKPGRLPGWNRALQLIENLAVSVTLAVLIAVPLLEMGLRWFSSGISGSNTWVQHFTLILGMAGGCVAAREKRLLALSPITDYLKGFWKEAATVFSGAFSAFISAFLCLASIQFVASEKTGDKILAYGIPIWVVQLVLPVGFGLIGLRLAWFASGTWRGRLGAFALAGALVFLGQILSSDPGRLFWPGIAGLGIATLLGAPIFITLGGLALLLLWNGQFPIAAIPLKHYSLVTTPALATIPLFTLAGYFLAEGGATRRVVRVFQALVGPIRGGPGIVTVLVCAYFTTFTGASGVTILALGGLLMPVLLSSGYSDRNALGLLTASGALGVLLPPCLPLILYSIVAGNAVANLDVASMNAARLTMEKMFLGGLLPGLLLIGLCVWWGRRCSPNQGTGRKPFDRREAWEAIWDAKWELLLPVVALVALFGGFASAVEAAALTAFYALFVEVVIYRDLSPVRGVVKVMTESGLLVGGVLLILGVAMGLTNYLVTEQVPDVLVEWVQQRVQSPWVFLLALNCFLLVVGCLMDIFSAIVVVVPLIVPLGVAFGIDPIHLGVIFLANLQLGYLTPPVGMNLFLASYRFNKPIPEVVRASMPIFYLLCVGVLIITYVPILSTWLPRFVK